MYVRARPRQFGEHTGASMPFAVSMASRGANKCDIYQQSRFGAIPALTSFVIAMKNVLFLFVVTGFGLRQPAPNPF